MKKVYKQPESRFHEFLADDLLIKVGSGDAQDESGVNDIDVASLSKERHYVDFSDEESIW